MILLIDYKFSLQYLVRYPAVVIVNAGGGPGEIPGPTV
ncbi:hypothetical protein J2T20_002882 [Paenibacillus wynnii]|nr:hypothetical protein [Paenibacillus wynnii]